MKKPLPFGKYLLLDRINVGGMAEVFLARPSAPEAAGKILAIKKIIPTMVEDEEFITMFIDEARIAVQLNHPNVVQISELGKVDEHYYITMQYVSGRDLRIMLDAVKKKKKMLPLPLSVFLASEVCRGLDYAHRKKDAQGNEMHIVHRDVSPQNVLVGYDGEVKVIDFGIAKAQNRSQKTQAGILKGKFGYMSPEQVRGMPIDRRSDIFALGVILYEMLTGERLFVGESDFSTLEKVRNAEVLPPREFNDAIPEALEAVVLRSLAREPEERYQWAAEMADDLAGVLTQQGDGFGRPQLAAFMRTEFAAEVEREEERLSRFLAEEAPSPIAPTLPSSPPTAPPAIRASSTWRNLAAVAGDEAPAEEVGAGEKTQLAYIGPEGAAPAPAAPPSGFGIRSAPTLAAPPHELPGGPPDGVPGEASEGIPTLLMPAVAGEPAPASTEGKTVIRVDVSGVRPPPGKRDSLPPKGAPPADGKTVIKAEASNPRVSMPGARAAPAVAIRESSGASSLPPAVRLVPAAAARSSRQGLPPWVLASAGGVGLGVVLLVLLVALRKPAPETGTLVITPSPAAGASLAVDGRSVPAGSGGSFLAAQLVPGDHVIEGKNKYGTRVLKVTLLAGATKAVAMAMAEAPPPPTPAPSAPVAPTATAPPKPPVQKIGMDLSGPTAPAAARVRVTLLAEPSEAELFVDRQSVGHPPYVLTSTDPQHLYHLRAVAPGRRPAEKSGRFGSDQTVTLVCREEHAGGGGGRHRRASGPPGTLVISSRPVAKVFVDGRATDRYTPVPPSSPLELPSGDHVIHLESDDGKTADRQVTIQPHTLTKLVGITLN